MSRVVGRPKAGLAHDARGVRLALPAIERNVPLQTRQRHARGNAVKARRGATGEVTALTCLNTRPQMTEWEGSPPRSAEMADFSAATSRAGADDTCPPAPMAASNALINATADNESLSKSERNDPPSGATREAIS